VSVLLNNTGTTPPDSDGVADDEDNCPDDPNADQADGDANGEGDACDSPKVMSTGPAKGATLIAPGVNVTFSEAMDASTTDGDPSTINGTTFKLVRLSADGTTTRVTATVSYAAATKRAKLDPASNLSPRRTYKATVTTGAQDLAANALDQNPNVANNGHASSSVSRTRKRSPGYFVLSKRRLPIVGSLA